MKPIRLPVHAFSKPDAALARKMKFKNPIAHKRPHRVDDKTIVYISVTATLAEIEDIVWKLQNRK